MKVIYAIHAAYWIVLSVLVLIGIVQLPAFCAACACLLAGLGFLNLYYED